MLFGHSEYCLSSRDNIEPASLADITPAVQPKTDLEDPVFEGMLAIKIPETPDVLTRPRPLPLAPPGPHTPTAI
jgi:hypothetical protein